MKLKLDFTIPDRAGRLEFVNTLLESYHPNQSETELIANYILWGKDPNDTTDYEIKTNFKAWQRREYESLEALKEAPGFNEAIVHPFATNRPKIPREVFDREHYLSIAGQYKDDLLALFTAIDELELRLNYYELDHNRRKKPPRDELLQRTKNHEELHNSTKEWSAARYLKEKHRLVELRQQQYIYKDCFAPRRVSKTALAPVKMPQTVEIPVFPLGLRYGDKVSSNLFKKIFSNSLDPNDFSEEELWSLEKLLEEKEQELHSIREEGLQYVDFREEEHLLSLLKIVEDFKDEEDWTANAYRNTLLFYIGFAELPAPQLEVIRLKILGWKNQDIADRVNEEFGKTYNVNYISTIYRQKAVKTIAKAVQTHLEAVENLFYPENFKKCTTCGKVLLRNTDFFAKRGKSSDGYSNRCKVCDRKKREEKKRKELC